MLGERALSEVAPWGRVGARIGSGLSCAHLVQAAFEASQVPRWTALARLGTHACRFLRRALRR